MVQPRIANSFITFENTIRMWTGGLIALADAIRVIERTIRESRNQKKILFASLYFFVITSPLCHKQSITVWNRLYYRRDNGVTTKKNCCHTHKLLSISIFASSVTTWQQNRVFSIGGEIDNTPSTLSVRRFLRRKLVLPPVHGFSLTIVRASPAVTHGAPPLEAWDTLFCCGCGGRGWLLWVPYSPWLEA